MRDLESTIRHWDEVAEREDERGQKIFAADHRQLAEWLRELKTYRLGKVSWKSPKAILPKDEKPVIVVNDDGLYAIAYLCRNEDWADEWRIMYCPYDSDIWEDGECGKIEAWAELPDVPSFPAFSLDRDKGRCNWCSNLEDRHLRIEYYWIDEEGNTASYVGKSNQVATGIARFCPCCGRKIEEVKADENHNIHL